MKRQGQKSGGRLHGRRAAERAMLSGNSASSTIDSGRRLNAISTRASTARPITNGRRRWGSRSRNPVAIRRPAAAAETPPRTWRSSGACAIAKAKHAERQTHAPGQHQKARDRGERPWRAAQFRAGADRDPNDIRSRQELAQADNIEEFGVAEPAPLFNGDAPGPDEPAAKAKNRYGQKRFGDGAERRPGGLLQRENGRRLRRAHAGGAGRDNAGAPRGQRSANPPYGRERCLPHAYCMPCEIRGSLTCFAASVSIWASACWRFPPASA